MSIKSVTTEELRRMGGKEALILQGCGGDLQEWVDGINEMLTKEKILLEGTKFQNCLSFEQDGIVCLLFPFEDVRLNIVKLAMWRLGTHGQFGGTWLSDYVPNRLGGFTKEKQTQKPDCPLIGADGNIFNLMGIAARTLKENGMKEQAEEMKGRITQSGSYHEALNIIGEYVNITSAGEAGDMDEGMEMQ